jgi:hypothetical protein
MGFAASRFIMASAARNRLPASMSDQYLGDGGISGNYPGPSRRPAGDGLTTPRDTMGGSV